MDNYTCSLPNYIAPDSQVWAVVSELLWLVLLLLTGVLSNTDVEDDAEIEISASMRDIEENLNNNRLDVRIVYATFADLSISTLYVF